MPYDMLMSTPVNYGKPFLNKTYSDFAKVIHALYPGSEEEHKWLVADMDKLVGERQ
jgi:hypothetical protein